MTTPIVQHLRSKVPGARPGDGTIRWLMDGERFINQHDGVECYLADTGALITVPLGSSASFAPLLALAGYTDLVSAQTIAGAKTFGLPPTIPNGIKPSDAAAMGQITPFDYRSNAKTIGASGNNSAVDTASLLAMAAAVSDKVLATFGASGYIPAGVYLCSQKLSCTLSGYQSLTLGCDGRHGAKLVFTNPQSCGIEIILQDQMGGVADAPQMLSHSVTVRNISILAYWTQQTSGTVVIGTGLSIHNGVVTNDVEVSPFPSVHIDNVSVHNVFGPQDLPTASGWAIHCSIYGLNLSQTDDLNCAQCLPGSTCLLIDSDSTHPSFIHKVGTPTFNGNFSTGIKVGKATNDAPLQGVIVNNPTIVSAQAGSIGIDCQSLPAAVNYVGDQLEVYGGHINCQGKGIHTYGWRCLIVSKVYMIVASNVVGVHVEGVAYGGPVTIDGTFLLGPGTSGNRAVQLDNLGSTFDVDVTYYDAPQPPVLITGSTPGGRVRGNGQCASFTPVLTDQSNNTNINQFDYVCNGTRLSSINAGLQYDYNGVLNIDATMINRPIFLTGPDPVTLPDPNTMIGANLIITNAYSGSANINGASGTNYVPPALNNFPSNNVVDLIATPGLWVIKSWSKVVAPA